MYSSTPVIRNKDLKGFDIATWYAICSFCRWKYDKKGLPTVSEAGSCFPTLERIAERAYISVDSVRRSLRNLERLGFVRTKAQYGKRTKGEKGEQRSNGYTLYPLGDAPE